METTMEATTATPFHEHLDACAQCREHPFDLCAEGEQLLITNPTIRGRPSLLHELVRAVVHEAAQHAIELASMDDAQPCGNASAWLMDNRHRLTAEVVEACFSDDEGDGPVDRLLAAITPPPRPQEDA